MLCPCSDAQRIPQGARRCRWYPPRFEPAWLTGHCSNCEQTESILVRREVLGPLFSGIRNADAPKVNEGACKPLVGSAWCAELHAAPSDPTTRISAKRRGLF